MTFKAHHQICHNNIKKNKGGEAILSIGGAEFLCCDLMIICKGDVWFGGCSVEEEREFEGPGLVDGEIVGVCPLGLPGAFGVCRLVGGFDVCV